jgi:hypothetical protein
MSRPHATLSSLSGLFFTALVAACGSGGAPSNSGPGYPSAGSPAPRLERSGSRLEVRGYDADGIFVLDGFYDTKLGFMCAPAIASDGVERCAPRDVLPLGPFADGSDSGPTTADASCSTPIVTIAKTTCSDPARVLVRSSTAVGGVDGRDRASYWHIGASISPAKIYTSSFGRCSESAPDPAYDYFELGSPLPPTDLVAFVRRDVAVSPALDAVVVEGDDGSRLQIDQDFIDVARNQPCEIAVADDGVSRCTPLSANLYQDRVFVDDGCLTHAAFRAFNCSRGLGRCDESTVTELVFGGPSSACVANRHRFYAAGPEVVTGEVRLGSGPAECGAPGKQSSPIVAVGSPIDPTRFPPVIAGSAASQSRLVERTLLVGGAPVRRAALFDPAIDDECHFEKAADGRTRCLPAHAVAPSRGFADAACTTPLFFADPCLPPPKRARIVEGAACDPVVRIRAVTAATHAFDRSADGTCVERPPTPEELVAGDEIPPTEFVEATPAKR